MDASWFSMGVSCVGLFLSGLALGIQHHTIKRQRLLIADLSEDLVSGAALLDVQSGTITAISEQYELLAHHCVGPKQEPTGEQRQTTAYRGFCPN